jgi:hypothetical protein
MKIYFLNLVYNNKDNDETFLILKYLFQTFQMFFKQLYASYNKPPL